MMAETGRHPLAGWQIPAIAAGAVALIAAIVGGMAHPSIFFRGYLVGFLFCVGLCIGSLAVLMIQYLTGGVWGIVIRRQLEAATRTLPVVAVMVIPILVALPVLYPWARPEVVAADPLIQHKAMYLNVPFMIARSVIYFALWIGAATFLTRTARNYDETGSQEAALQLRKVSGLGLVVLALTVTFSAVDWGMSLDPHWFSTMYGLAFVVEHMLSALAFAVVILVTLSRTRPLSDVLLPSHLRDLGNLLLAFVMLWAYLNFSQFLLIWYANLREEVTFYIPRMEGFWGGVSALLIVFHFFLPFFMLLMRAIKDRPATLRLVALLILVMHLFSLLWIVVPSVQWAEAHGIGHGDVHAAGGHGASWLDFLVPVGLIAIWFGFFVNRLSTASVLPINEPYVQEALSGEAIHHG